MFWKKKKEEAIPAGIEWLRDDDDGVHVVHIRGVLTDDMFKELQNYAAKEIGKMGSIKGLMILDGFQGWPKGARSDNLDFLLQYDSRIEKMAVVGDLQWKEDFLMFLGAGYRKAQIQYFQPEDSAKAREWLNV